MWCEVCSLKIVSSHSFYSASDNLVFPKFIADLSLETKLVSVYTFIFNQYA